jgi:hypothetical protein
MACQWDPAGWLDSLEKIRDTVKATPKDELETHLNSECQQKKQSNTVADEPIAARMA